MSCIQQFSDVTKNYLCRFYKILDEMIEGMTNAELTSSLSHNFIVQMIPHHRAAIEMSENLLQFTTFVPLQHIAQNIINEQTKSIENMPPNYANNVFTNVQCLLRQQYKCGLYEGNDPTPSRRY